MRRTRNLLATSNNYVSEHSSSNTALRDRTLPCQTGRAWQAVWEVRWDAICEQGRNAYGDTSRNAQVLATTTPKTDCMLLRYCNQYDDVNTQLHVSTVSET